MTSIFQTKNNPSVGIIPSSVGFIGNRQGCRFYMTYAEKLKDPRWQKKRLEILNLFSFRCQRCECEYKTLHVHHKTYEYGNDPWDYKNNNFMCLCEDCHEVEHNSKVTFSEMVHDYLVMGGNYEELVFSFWNRILKDHSSEYINNG
jgi:hypothetical protein